ncbi:MAG: hypothetical protein QM765_33250 [Myxococcales bacterium]
MEPVALAVSTPLTTAPSGEASLLVVGVAVAGIVLLGLVLPVAIATWWMGGEER